MPWKKTKLKNRDCYTLSDTEVKYLDIKSVTLDQMNDPDRHISLSENPNFLKEYIDDSNIEELPAGIYNVVADGIFSDPKLVPIAPAHDDVLFELSVIDLVLQDFRAFTKNKNLYKKLGILNKRGVLLYGAPGTGKTTAINLIVSKLRPKDSIVLYVSRELPVDLIEEFKSDSRLKIIIFEELTETVERYGTNGLLRFLDGENSLDNMYVIATTNYPEELPGNIVDRPGRFDKLYQINLLADKDREKYLKHLLKRNILKAELVATKSMSIAQIKETILLSKLYDVSIISAVDLIKSQKETAKKKFKNRDSEAGF